MPTRVELPVFDKTDEKPLGEVEKLIAWASDFPAAVARYTPRPVASGEITWDAKQQFVACKSCDSTGVRALQKCHCAGDPRCNTCQGRGEYIPACHRCAGTGKIPQVYHFRLLSAEGVQDIAIKPSQLERASYQPGQFLTVSPIPGGHVYRHQNEEWSDPATLFTTLRANNQGAISAAYWTEQLHRMIGITSAEQPYTITVGQIPDEETMVRTMVELCDAKKLGFMISLREGAMGTGEMGWAVWLLSSKGYRELSVWYSLPLALYNALEKLRNFKTTPTI